MRIFNLFIIFFLVPFNIYASCCSSSGASNFAKLKRHERATISHSLSNKKFINSYNSKGSSSDLYVKGQTNNVTTFASKVNFRTIKDFIWALHFPIDIAHARQSSMSAQLKDAKVFVSKELLEKTKYFYLPSATLMIGTTIPYAEQNYFLFSFGGMLEKSFNIATFGVSYILQKPLLVLRKNISQPFLGHLISLSQSYIINHNHVIGCNITHNIEGPFIFDNISLPDSLKQNLQISFSYSYSFQSLYKIVTSIAFDPPNIGFIKWQQNVLSGITLNIGMSLGII